MAEKDIRPFAQKFAMKVVSTRPGLRFSLRSARKAAGLPLDGVQNDTIQIPRSDGSTIRARVYKPLALPVSGDLPIVVNFHGGAYATGWPERHHAYYKRLMEARPCIIVAPAFRSSLDAPYPAGHDDCYDTLLWVRDNAARLGGSADKIILSGNSSGGGMAISTAMRARDSGDVTPAFVVALYPMIDDCGINWKKVPRHHVTWSQSHNVLAWHLLLKDLRAQKRYDIPAYAVPARATDLSGLPPMLSFVGDRDIFETEDIAFFDRLGEAGADVTFRVFNDTFHAMEDSAPDLPQSQEINRWVSEEFAKMVDKYC